MKLGKVSITNKVLLSWLHFEDGRIVDIRSSCDKVGVLDVLIEHSEMPEYTEGDYVVPVLPLYTTQLHKKCGHQTITREPLKGESNAT
ncbi:hypothetical protein LCGC14_0406070 [marine sediment metagenome]|uniref:Uncharacterized protein n=1 Tax=marine sediment metagenome TaxID=412755 RepID=A0A0F9W4E6_9ZZZZ